MRRDFRDTVVATLQAPLWILKPYFEKSLAIAPLNYFWIVVGGFCNRV